MENNLQNKDKIVRNVFNSVANKYDLMNDLMSFGIHRIWKKEMINILQPQPHEILLDVAGGTGDIARGFLNRGGGKAIICDINSQMLIAGLCSKASINNLELICGNGEKLPFKNNMFDSYSIAFGIRNITNKEVAITEALRVLKPMGKFVCMEFVNTDPSLFVNLYDFYSQKIIPKIGKVVAKDSSSYEYLVESIRKFPKPDKFVDTLKNNGVSNIRTLKLMPYVAAIYYGYKI